MGCGRIPWHVSAAALREPLPGGEVYDLAPPSAAKRCQEIWPYPAYAIPFDALSVADRRRYDGEPVSPMLSATRTRCRGRTRGDTMPTRRDILRLAPAAALWATARAADGLEYGKIDMHVH